MYFKLKKIDQTNQESPIDPYKLELAQNPIKTLYILAKTAIENLATDRSNAFNFMMIHLTNIKGRNSPKHITATLILKIIP